MLYCSAYFKLLLSHVRCTQCTNADYCYGLRICVSVGHNHEPSKNRQTDHGAVWDVDSSGHNNNDDDDDRLTAFDPGQPG